jgi:hypothetical protein
VYVSIPDVPSGLFWFHSHMLPGDMLFGGVYGLTVGVRAPGGACLMKFSRIAP